MSSVEAFANETLASASRAVRIYFQPLSWLRGFVASGLERFASWMAPMPLDAELNALLNRQVEMLAAFDERIQALSMSPVLLERWEAQITRLEQDVEMSEHSVYVFLRLASSLHQRGETDWAKHVLQRLLPWTERTDSKLSRYVLLNLAELHIEKATFEEAAELLHRVLEQNAPADQVSAAAASNLALLNHRLHNSERAAEFFDQAVRALEALEPDELGVRGYAQLATICLERGEVLKAEALLERVIHLTRRVEPLLLPKLERG